MGKKDKNKKKGKGAEKTLLKTEKKLSNKQKKELEALGEDNIENILAQIEFEEKKRNIVTDVLVDPPSRRVNFTFIPHPESNELILYGGEFFDGQKTFLYNDLFFYNIANNTWSLIKAPNGPPPRCGHQMVATSTNKGQLWVFGGEFASPTQAQFYHYRDLWLFHIAEKRWEKIVSQNAPSARSGHRMVYMRKKIYLFGGFHDNLHSDYKYHNDVYAFDIETYIWTKIEAVGNVPAPRSGSCVVPLQDGKILIYGGYSKEKIKKDVDKGKAYTDSFLLTPEKNDETGLKFKWIQHKLGNSLLLSPRCSMPITLAPNNTAYCFGGVYDVEDDEDMDSTFFNELFALDLQKFAWRSVNLSERKINEDKSRRRKNKDNDEESEEATEMDTTEIDSTVDLEAKVEPTVISDDGIFTVTVGPSTSNISNTNVSSNLPGNNSELTFHPSPRMNSGLAIKHGILYLYGGLIDEGDKQITLRDFYSLDMKKLNEWRTIISDDSKKMEWLGSDSEDEKEDMDEDDADEDQDSSSDEGD